MNRQVVLRLLDTYFRRWWLYLVPVLVLGVAGVWSATSAEDSYSSVGTMKVERSTLLGDVTGTEQDPDFGWLSPAAATAESINAMLRTESFIDDVVVGAGLEDAVESGVMTTDEVRASIGVWPDGSKLVKFVGTSRFPDVAHRVAGATINAYTQSVIDNENRENTRTIEVLQGQIPEYEQAADDAQAELGAWLEGHPAPTEGEERPGDEQVQLDRLEAAAALRYEDLANVEQDIQRAQLSQEVTGARVEQRLEVIDTPEPALAPQPKLRKAFLKVAMALVLGAVVGMIAVVIGTITDRTIRFPGDVKAKLDTRVLAVVPHTRPNRAVREYLQAAQGSTSAAAADEHPAASLVALPGRPADDATNGNGRGTVAARQTSTSRVRASNGRWTKASRSGETRPSELSGERR